MVLATITKLVNCVCELEFMGEFTHSDRLEAKRFQQQLTNLDGEFKTYHLAVVDLLEEEHSNGNMLNWQRSGSV